jgi:hypothetical protein
MWKNNTKIKFLEQTKHDIMAYFNMSRVDEIILISEHLNGKVSYNDSEIAFGMALLAEQNKLIN